jgi:hypothetical protein
MVEKLCPNCQENNACLLEKHLNLISSVVPDVPNLQDVKTFEKIIDIVRKEAMTRGCTSTYLDSLPVQLRNFANVKKLSEAFSKMIIKISPLPQKNNSSK